MGYDGPKRRTIALASSVRSGIQLGSLATFGRYTPALVEHRIRIVRVRYSSYCRYARQCWTAYYTKTTTAVLEHGGHTVHLYRTSLPIRRKPPCAGDPFNQSASANQDRPTLNDKLLNKNTDPKYKLLNDRLGARE